MLSLLFIHGTGVRTQEFEHTLAAINERLAGDTAVFDVAGCDWGKDHGARPGQMSIPNYAQAKSVDDEGVREPLLDPWAQLVSDPFIEIRLVARLAGDDGSLFSKRRTAKECEAEVIAALAHLPLTASHELRDPDAAAVLHAAVTVFAHQDVDAAWTHALDSEPNIDDGIIAGALMLARAIVARWMVSRFEQGFPAVPGAQRDALVNWLAGAMSGTTAQTKGVLADAFALAMAPIRKLGAGALGLGARMGTFALRRHRTGLSDAASSRVGDILLYQARGQAIRQKIEKHILAAKHPVVLLAHSLGGIACVDLLAATQGLPVLGLVTVGSQAPYLHEMGALWSLEPGHPLPKHFPPWLNFYDLNDLLSYLAKPVFGDRVVEDVEIKSGQPFPLSHSAYWTDAGLWDRLRAFAEDLPK